MGFRFFAMEKNVLRFYKVLKCFDANKIRIENLYRRSAECETFWRWWQKRHRKSARPVDWAGSPFPVASHNIIWHSTASFPFARFIIRLDDPRAICSPESKKNSSRRVIKSIRMRTSGEMFSSLTSSLNESRCLLPPPPPPFVPPDHLAVRICV